MATFFLYNTYRENLGCTLFGQDRARNSLKAAQVTSAQGSHEGRSQESQGFFDGWLKEEARRLLMLRPFVLEAPRTLREKYDQILMQKDEKLLCEFLKLHPEALVLLLADNRLKEEGKVYILNKLPEACLRAAFDHLNRVEEKIKAMVEPFLKAALNSKPQALTNGYILNSDLSPHQNKPLAISM